MSRLNSLQSLQSVAIALTLNSLVSAPLLAQSTSSLATPTSLPVQSTPLPPVAQPTPPTNQPLRPIPTDYFLGAGDQVDIKVFDYDEYTSSQVIMPDGSITLPLIGKVAAAGRTVDQLTQDLTARLSPLLKKPVVTIGLSKLRPIRINVAGEVQRPGPIQLQSLVPTGATNTTDAPHAPTVSEALLLAGGVTRDADIRQIILKRYRPTADAPVITLNLWDALKSNSPPPDLVLQDGDSLFVPKVDPANPLDRSVARASFAPKTVRVRVVGEVKKPGEVDVPPDSSLSSAVAIAGGPTDKARLSRVTFVRLNANGSVEKKEINLSSLVDNFQVQDGDVLIVPKSSTSAFVDLAGQLLGPLGFFVNLFK